MNRIADTSGSIILPSPDNIEASLVRLEGKIDRVIDNQSRHADDVKAVRQRLHDHAHQLTNLMALNLPGRFAAVDEDLKEHDSRLNLCETDMQQRHGAAIVIRAIWALVCLVGASGVIATIRMMAGR